MAAILNQITILFDVHQQEMLCYCCRMVLLISVEAVLRNLWSHTCISHSWMYSFLVLCKLSHGSHIELNHNIVKPATTTVVMLLLLHGTTGIHWSSSEKPLITYMHLPSVNVQFSTFMQIKSWRPCWPNHKIVQCASTTVVVLLLLHGTTGFNWSSSEKPLITFMHLQHMTIQFCTFMQIKSWQPYWTQSKNCSMCINYICCVTVVAYYYWFQLRQFWETFDHTHASPTYECTFL